MRIAKGVFFAVSFFTTLPLAIGQVVTGGKSPNLPPPYVKPIVSNPAEVVPAPGFMPKAIPGFTVSLFASGFKEPRWLAVAPNGDVFVAELTPGKVWVLHDPSLGAPSDARTLFAEGLDQPFGIAFLEDYVYIADNDELIRFRYDPKTSHRLGDRENILELPRAGMHTTRTVQFSLDGKKMFVSSGSSSNVDPETDERRAAIMVANPDGSNHSIYASGLRNGVGIAVNPDTGELWVSVNERDLLGDNLPPDYFTRVVDGGFYGWPYSYIGQHVDDRAKPPRPDLVAKAIVPDVLLGAHVAPLQFTFYTGKQFPSQYQHGAFLAEHGSWNRSILAGYQVVFIPFQNGRATAPPTPFLTGFMTDPNSRTVNGRPVGVAVAQDGSLLVSDDGGNVIWRVSKSK